MNSSSPGESARPHTHTQELGMNPPESPSSALARNRLSQTSPENECVRCIEERRRAEAILADFQNLQADVIAKNRVIGRLKAEVAQHRDEEPEATPVKELLVYAKEKLGKTKRWYIGMDGDRAKLAKKVYTRYGLERCKKAVDGLAAEPHVGPRGRSASPYPGSERRDDVDYCWGTDKRFTDREAVAEALERPTLEAVPEPESESRQFVRYVYGEDCLLPYVPASKDRPPRPRRDPLPPIDHALGAVVAAGCEWRATASPDRWRAQCPSHQGDGYSLAIQRNGDGTILLHCHRGCSFEEVLSSLGMEAWECWEHSELDWQATEYRSQEERGVSLPPHLRHEIRRLLAEDDQRRAA